MSTDERHHYEVIADDDRFAVVDRDAHVICRCRTEPDAQNYASLLNRAFQRGYKAGYRAGKAFRADEASG